MVLRLKSKTIVAKLEPNYSFILTGTCPWQDRTTFKLMLDELTNESAETKQKQPKK